MLKHKIMPERCTPIMEMTSTCGICVNVCPVQRYGLAEVLGHYRATGGEILGKGTDELEGYSVPGLGYFGPGQRPAFERHERTIDYELAESIDVEPWPPESDGSVEDGEEGESR
ncbi:MAG: hypothetical protein QM733_15070 [Ilumatobacteraceae bacterium]